MHASASLRFFCFFVRIHGCFGARGSILKFVGNAFLAGGWNDFFVLLDRAPVNLAGGGRHLRSNLPTRKGSKSRTMQNHAETRA